MVWFLIKKSFFDSVDNLVSFLLANFVSAVPIVGLYFLVKGNQSGLTGNVALLIFFLFLGFCFIAFGISGMSFGWGNYRRAWFDSFTETFKGHLKHCFVFVFLLVFIVVSAVLCIPFYLGSMSYLGVFMAFLLFWVVMIACFSAMYFCPLMNLYQDEKPLSILKRSLGMAYRNKGFSIAVAIITCIELILSVLTCSVVPGVSGVGLLHTDAVRLLTIKEEYILEKGIKSKEIDYNTMLAEEKENVGKRTLKNFFSPWKNSK